MQLWVWMLACSVASCVHLQSGSWLASTVLRLTFECSRSGDNYRVHMLLILVKS
jgi:hypothetical protein